MCAGRNKAHFSSFNGHLCVRTLQLDHGNFSGTGRLDRAVQASSLQVGLWNKSMDRVLNVIVGPCLWHATHATGCLPSDRIRHFVLVAVTGTLPLHTRSSCLWLSQTDQVKHFMPMPNMLVDC